MNKLKVGDKVRVICDVATLERQSIVDHPELVGAIGTIDSIAEDENDYCAFCICFPAPINDFWHLSKEDIELVSIEQPQQKQIRQFDSGATRDQDLDKLDFEGFLSPIVLNRFAQYMHKHRKQSDGNLRDSDNWQKGIPIDAYMKSGFRHFFDWWSEHRNHKSREGIEDALCGLMFNTMGYLFEILKKKNGEEK